MGPVGTAVAALVLGFVSGIVSAIAGVGGAVVTTPGVRAIGATPLQAVGSTVPAVIPAAITGSIRYAKEGLIRWRVALWCGAAGTAFAALGVWASTKIDGGWLMVATAILVLYSSGTILWKAHAGRRELRLQPVGAAVATELVTPVGGESVAALIAVGVAAGFLAGVLGVGGGLILVPAFTGLLRLPVKEAVATSLVAVALMSITSLVGHAMAGHIDWTYAIPLAIGVIPGARVGSLVLVRSSEQRMRVICGVVLGILGLVYLATELAKVV
jgi:uncharacterized membrane protein YfcA